MEIILLLIIIGDSGFYNMFQYGKINKLTNENISEEEKKYIIFAIDMYIDYCEELNIVSKDKHEILVSKLEEIKNKMVTSD